MTDESICVGVDGWRGGWVVAVAEGRRIEWHLRETFGAILADWPGVSTAVDMPVVDLDGNPDDKARHDADSTARTWLRSHGGSPSSIFPTPPHSLLRTWTPDSVYAEEMKRLDDRAEPRVSKQSWNLIGKIREVAAAARPGIVEAHPECSFAMLTEVHDLPEEQAPVRRSKKSALGMALRLEVLRLEFDLPPLTTAPAQVPIDDLLDACAVAWTAQRYTSDRDACVTFPDGAKNGPRIVV